MIISSNTHSIFFLSIPHSTLQVWKFEVCFTFHTFQTEVMKTFVIRALSDTLLEGDEHFTVRLFPAASGAVIDPLNGQFLWRKFRIIFHGCNGHINLPHPYSLPWSVLHSSRHGHYHYQGRQSCPGDYWNSRVLQDHPHWRTSGRLQW